MTSPHPTWAALVALALAGCEEAAEPTTYYSTTDSAGVAIIENLAPAWGAAEAWRLAERPLLSIGTVDGPDGYQLYRVRDAHRLADGRIVVANAGTNELRFYAGDGTHLFDRGGEGGGPGEFRSLGEIWPLGDSLFLFDFNQMRITVYSTAGTFGRTFRVHETPDGAFPIPAGVLAGRTLLVRRSPRDAELGAGFSRDTSLYLRYTLEGEPADSIGRFPGRESYTGFREDFTYGTSAPFGRRSYMMPFGDRLFYGSSDRYEIEVRAADGTLERLIRRPLPNPPVTAEEVEEFHRDFQERAPRMSPMWRELYESMTLPETKPAYGRLIVDSEGNLWVAEYTQERDDEGTWTVFDPAGRLLGQVETPTGGRLLQIGSDFVLGVWRDELDVEQVRLYRLLKAD